MAPCPCCERTDHQSAVKCLKCDPVCLHSLTPYWQGKILALEAEAQTTNRSLIWETALAKLRHALTSALADIADAQKVIRELK